MQFVRLSDRVETDATSEKEIDLSAFPGTWKNANPDTKGIARLEMSTDGTKLSLRVFAIGPDGVIDWGPATNVGVYTSTQTSRVGAGFTCRYDFGFAETELQGNINKGLIVLAQFHKFKDESKRVDYFTREYFALSHDRY